jgi:hypothetical protein
MNADSRQDLVLSDHTGSVWVHPSTSDSFAQGVTIAENLCGSQVRCRVGDMDGDGRIDLVAFDEHGTVSGDGYGPHHLREVEILLSLGGTNLTQVPIHHELDCENDDHCRLADVNGDGRMDVVEVLGRVRPDQPDDRHVFVSTNTGILCDDSIGRTTSCSAALGHASGPGPACVPTPGEPETGWRRISRFPVDRVVATTEDLYARSAQNHKVYRYDTGTTWRPQSDPVGDLVATRDDVFAVGPDHDYVIKRVGEALWAGIAGPVQAIFAGPSGMFTYGERGDAWGFECRCGDPNPFAVRPGWTRIGAPGLSMAVGGLTPAVDDALPDLRHLYLLNSLGVWAFNRVPVTWSRVGGPASAIWAGADWLYAKRPGTGELLARRPGTDSFVRISGPALEFAVDQESGEIYRRTADGVDRWSGSGTTWVDVGGPAGRIFVAQEQLFKTDPATGELYVLEGN